MKSGSLFLFLLLFLLLNPDSVFAQFAKIVDKDRYVNVRHDAKIKSKIIGMINSDEIVYIFDKSNDSADWLIVDYKKNNGKFLSGYIHQSRLNTLVLTKKYRLLQMMKTELSSFCEI